MSEIDVSKCEFYNENYCDCYKDIYGYCYHKCTDYELKNCYYKQLQKLKQKMNNFDKIKSMTVDEMAVWLQAFSLDSMCNFCIGCYDKDKEICCLEGLKQWLLKECE